MMYVLNRTVLEPVRETEITTVHHPSIAALTTADACWAALGLGGEVIDIQRHSRTVDAVGGGG